MVRLIFNFLMFCFTVGFNQLLLADVPVQEWTTPKNIHTIFVQDTSTDLISVNFAFKGTGARTDPAGKEGLSALMTQLLLERNKEDGDRYTLQKKLKTLGVIYGIQYSVDADNINFWFKCPKEKLKNALEIVKIIITTPAFDEKELAKIKNFDPAGARLATSTEQEFANKVLIQKLLSPHPYGIPSTGTLDGRQTITIEDLKEAAQNRFARRALVFSIVGNIAPQTLTQYIDTTFGKLPENTKLPSTPKATIKSAGEIIFIPKDTQQSGVVFGQAGISVQNKDYLPLLIINDILGGKPFTSRLWLEAREKHGLVYSIQTDIFNWEYASLLIGGFECDNKVVEKVINLVRNEWKNLRETGISEAEFKAAKTGLQGSFVLTFSTPDGIGQYLLRCYLNDLPINYINQRNKLLELVTFDDVNKVAQNLLDPEKLTFVAVGNKL